ncbi:MAG: hypothetical protein DRI71_02535 [Bacteroidetes bacterium]|nr:MAG: hypothetical protein DRI71_02535 [Bacteroidota bacterium]
MELKEFKTAWTKQKTIGYSQEELDSIYHIKQKHSLESFKLGLSWDLAVAIIISIAFIVVLQVLDYRASNFWSICMALFAAQHVLFYRFQVYLLRKYSVFNNDVSQSLANAISKIKGLLWFYRLWPAALTIILSVVYIVIYKPQQPVWLMLLVGTSLAIVISALSNVISAVLVRKHLIKLQKLEQDLLTLRE